MLTQIQSITLYVNDQDTALDFYVNKLGWEKRNDMPFGEGVRWLEVAPRGAQTVLILAKGYGGWSPDKVGGHSGMTLHADDVRATYDTLRQRGVQFTEEVSQQFWGLWTAFVDPDGNHFFLGSNEQPTGRPLISHIHFMSIYVHDLDATANFYVHKLGFEKQTDAAMGDQRWIELGLPGAETRLIPISHFADWSAERVGQFSRLVLACDNCQATYEQLSARGVPFTETPTPQPYGLTQAQFTDQDGNGYVLIGS